MMFQTILHNEWDLGMITKYFHSFMNSVSWVRINACEEILDDFLGNPTSISLSN